MPGEELPVSAEHKFGLVWSGEVILTETVDYVQSKISYPTNIARLDLYTSFSSALTNHGLS